MANIGSILMADFGSVHTRVVLVDVVDGEYRIVAREEGLTTLGYPENDISVGLNRLISHIETVTGRQFYDASGQIITPEDENRRGVDIFITTSSAGRPIRAVMVGLMPDISLTTALRAISGAYVEPVARIHLRDGLSEEERLNAMILGRPDLIFISGGTDGGAQNALMKILETVRLALRIIDPSLRPTVVYAGNNNLSDKIEAMFGELTTLLQAQNIRPTMQDESFESVLTQLGVAYDNYRESADANFANVQSSTGILPTSQSYVSIAEYYARLSNGNVLAVDIGSTSSVLVGVLNGRTSTRISTTKGVGHSAYTLLQEVGEPAVAEWLPFYPEPNEIANYALNKAVRPSSIPMTLRELYLEHGLMRAGVRQLVQRARELWVDVDDVGPMPVISTIVAGGSTLTNTGNAAYNMLLIADCLQPTGITEIKADTYGIIPAMSALARANPAAVVQLLEGEGLEHLGTLISIDGQPEYDKVVAHLKIETGGESIEAELRGGHFFSLPVPQNISLEIRVRCVGGHSIGGKTKMKLLIAGGTAGIVFDARGRVFAPPARVEKRAEQMPQWVSDATDNPLIPVPEDWLIQPDAPAEEQVVIKRETKRTQSGRLASEALDELQALSQGDDDFDLFGDMDDEDTSEKEDEEEFDLRDLL